MHSAATIAPWRQAQFTLTARRAYTNPYTDVEVWADFVHDDGATLRRPAFWDGGSTWHIRFASPLPAGVWRWRSDASVDDPGLRGITGTVNVEVEETTHRFYRHGFWKMSPQGRSLVHADGTPAVLVADTAWAFPWRATETDALDYARDRATKGFNAALLMSVQPDMRARGPRERTADEGFGVGFEDLPTGHINELSPEYFQTLDRLLAILVEHGIVPVLQPVFQGFGWKGLDVAGTVVPAEEYARYCRYLVARYGAAPALYLVGADGTGREPQVAAGGREVGEWDCYRQPTGIHYRPHIDAGAHQDADWLDFQWCQTGHTGEHIPERVADMWRNNPPKAVANGEPTYEHTRSEDMGPGWWQGHEAWSNLCAGGTMGVVYGAANIWQWRLHPDEPGHADYFLAPGGGWRESLDLPGSTYVGLVGKILEGLPTTDMHPDWQTVFCPRGLHAPGFHLIYQENGGTAWIASEDDLPRHYRIVDPRTGAVRAEGERGTGKDLPDTTGRPTLIIFCNDVPTSQGAEQ